MRSLGRSQQSRGGDDQPLSAALPRRELHILGPSALVLGADALNGVCGALETDDPETWIDWQRKLDGGHARGTRTSSSGELTILGLWHPSYAEVAARVRCRRRVKTDPPLPTACNTPAPAKHDVRRKSQHDQGGVAGGVRGDPVADPAPDRDVEVQRDVGVGAVDLAAVVVGDPDRAERAIASDGAQLRVAGEMAGDRDGVDVKALMSVCLLCGWSCASCGRGPRTAGPAPRAVNGAQRQPIPTDPSVRAASTRSADLFSSLVEIAPSDPCLAETWRAILAVLREQGDFGAMDFESDDLVAWAKRDRTEHVLADIVRRLEEPTSYALRRAVGADIHDETAAQVRLKGQSQPVYVSKHRVVMKFDVRGVERFWIQFYAHSRGEAFFIAEARHQDPKAELDPALRALPGLQHGRDSTGHSWKLPSIRAKDLPSGAAVHDALLEHIAETIGALQASGLFDRLPDGPATAQPEFESPDAADGEAPAQM